MDVNYLRKDLETFVKSFDNNLRENHKNINQNERQNMDQLWTDFWVNTHLNPYTEPNLQIHEKIKSNEIKVNINDFKNELKSVLNLFNDFNKNVNNLSENIKPIDELKRISQINDLNVKKVILTQKLSSIQSKLPLIKKKIYENKRKRSKKSNKNIKHKNLFNQSLKNRNQIINKWFESNQRVEDMTQNKKHLESHQNIQIIELKNKIQNIRTRLKKVNKLQKLRNNLIAKALRRNQVINPQNEEQFERKTAKTKTKLNEKLNFLREEEKRVTSLAEKESQRQSDNKKEETFDEINEIEEKINESMFGSQSFPEPNNLESLKNWQIFERSHQNIENMIENRISWDRHLDMSGGTSIPKTFLMPNNKPNDNWSQYLIK